MDSRFAHKSFPSNANEFEEKGQARRYAGRRGAPANESPIKRRAQGAVEKLFMGHKWTNLAVMKFYERAQT